MVAAFKEKHKNINPKNISAIAKCSAKCNLKTSFVIYLVAIFYI